MDYFNIQKIGIIILIKCHKTVNSSDQWITILKTEVSFVSGSKTLSRYNPVR